MLKTKMMEQNLKELALYSKSGELPLAHKAKTVLSSSFKSEVENKESKLHRSGQAAIFQEEISNIALPLTIGNKDSAKLDNKNFQEFKDIYDICARACLLRICQLPKVKENFSPLSAFMRKHHSHLEDPLLLTLHDQNTQLRQKEQQKDNELSVQGKNELDYHLDTELSLVTYFKEFLDSLISNSPNSHQVKQQ